MASPDVYRAVTVVFIINLHLNKNFKKKLTRSSMNKVHNKIHNPCFIYENNSFAPHHNVLSLENGKLWTSIFLTYLKATDMYTFLVMTTGEF